MKKKSVENLAMVVILASLCGCTSQTMSIDEPALTSESARVVNKGAQIEQWLAALSPQQKVQLLVGGGFSMQAESGSQKVPGAGGSTAAIPELSIPSLVLADGPAGVRINPKRENSEASYYATAFPIATQIASTWNPTLAQQVGAAMGNEAKEYGIDVLLAPGMNIQYNPLAGRNFEYYAEDPYLSGLMAAAMVKGVQQNGVGATLKHFVANSAETNRFWLDAKISERALRETYLRGFEIAVKQSQPWAIMASYNKVNGILVTQNAPLLTGVLRDEWGYDGIVMTDWFAGENAVEQINAGIDLLMPGIEPNKIQLSAGLASGELTASTLDRSTQHLLNLISKSSSYQQYVYSEAPDLAQHARLAREVAAEGTILLKNDAEALPFKPSQSVALFGNHAYDFISGGTGSGDVNEAYTVSLLEGLKKQKVSFNQALAAQYQKYIASQKANQPPLTGLFDSHPPITELLIETKQIKQLAQTLDLALITLGRVSGESKDRQLAADYELSDAEKLLLSRVSEQFHAQGKKVVMILNIGNAIDITSWQDKVDAVVVAWQGGQEAGNALTDVLTGKISPSGKLPITFAQHYSDISSAVNFPGVITKPEMVRDPHFGMFSGYETALEYRDDIYVGYKHFEQNNVTPAYEFGFGLSYSEFKYTDAELQLRDDGRYTLTVKVTNSGKFAAKEVVQLYISAPQNQLYKPQQELKGFAKSRLLKPGEEQLIDIDFSLEELASFDPGKRAWLAEKGDYQLRIGASSQDIRLKLPLKLQHSAITQTVSTSL